jgi:hexosaminidase
MRHIFIGCILLGVSLQLSCTLFRQSIPVIPIPFEFETKDGRFIINDGTKIFADTLNNRTAQVAEYFVNLINSGSGNNFEIEYGEPSEIQLKYIFLSTRFADSTLGPEGYTLSVNENRISIRALQPAGLFYGVQTLRQLLPAQLESSQPVTGIILEVPCIEIRDKPRFKWRGMHLDVCRHFFPKEFIKQYINYLALHKINRFHWHLTEDQGWRIEIKQFPRLTSVGAWRVDRKDQPWRRREPPRPGEKATYGGFYTQDDVREIVQYAADNFIVVIPEIEMPGHATAALASYPQYSCTGGPFYVYPGSYWPIEDIFCAGNDRTFTFLEGILEEVITLFPGEYIHIGGDEARKARWEKCSKCQARIAVEGLVDEDELQSYFIKRIESFLNKKGKRLIGWDEILEGGLAPNATVMSWQGMDGGIAAANAGHDVVMSPTSYCYFNFYQGRNDEPLAYEVFLPIEKVYKFEPVPPSIEKSKVHHILGGQANLWTEFIPTAEIAEYMLLPRLSALAEVVWSPISVRDYDNFNHRLLDFYDRLAWMDINFRIPPPLGLGGSDIFYTNTTCKIEAPYNACQIRYTLDGSDPTYDSPLYQSPLIISKTTWVKARTFLRNGRMSVPATKIFHLVNPDENGIAYSYYEGDWKKLPDVRVLKPDKTGEIFDIGVDITENRDINYAVLYESNLDIDRPGEYTFLTINDDGVRLVIDDEFVINDSGLYGQFENSGKIVLEKGIHSFKFLTQQRHSGKDLKVQYIPPGGVLQPIPASIFKKSAQAHL